MYKLSDIAGKEVVGLYEAKALGRIEGALFSAGYRRLKLFEVRKSDGTSAFISPKCTLALSGDVVVVRNLGGVIERDRLAPSYLDAPVNRAVYSCNGEFLGELADVEVSGEQVVGFTVRDKTFTPHMLVTYSEDMLFFSLNGKLKATPPVKRQASATPSTANNTATPETETNSNLAAEAQGTNESTDRVDVPVRISSPRPDDGTRSVGYAFLLGKLVTHTVLSDNGTVIAAEGSTIGEAQLAAATAANKLVQLALHSR